MSIVSSVSKENTLHEDPRGKLTLLISSPPSEADEIVKKELTAFDSKVRIVMVEPDSKLFTPRLDATEANGSRYRGLESILAFLSQQRRWDRQYRNNQ